MPNSTSGTKRPCSHTVAVPFHNGSREDIESYSHLCVSRLTKSWALPECIEHLEHHWPDLTDERKQTFAQMAVVTR